MDDDYKYALELDRQLNGSVDSSSQVGVARKQTENKENVGSDDEAATASLLSQTRYLVHPAHEYIDPTPNVHTLFLRFDERFFERRLGAVVVEWSKRMTTCAGICYLRSRGLNKVITIRLSEPLLKLRSRKDLVETLLHEMIHAYCFIRNIREDNGGHGPQFKRMMHSINQLAGTNISVYHSFHDEVKLYKQHCWRCTGPCRDQPPYYGHVKRAMNRKPGPNDFWFAAHERSCGGVFVKIKEPEKKPTASQQKKPGHSQDMKKPAISQGKKPTVSQDIKPKEQHKPATTTGDLRKYFPPSTATPAFEPNSSSTPTKFNAVGGTLVDRDHLRDLWSKRFAPPNAKRPKLATPPANASVILISDSDEDEQPRATSKRPNTSIKQEMLLDNDMSEGDIILIDDEYDDALATLEVPGLGLPPTTELAECAFCMRKMSHADMADHFEICKDIFSTSDGSIEEILFGEDLFNAE